MSPSSKSKTDPLVADITPGEILATEFLEPLEISPYRLAMETGMPRSRISGILKGKRSITAETALALGLYFGISPQFWLNLQTHFDLEKATRHSLEKIKAKVKPLQAA
jgi:addiction module HigA family antidote